MHQVATAPSRRVRMDDRTLATRPDAPSFRTTLSHQAEQALLAPPSSSFSRRRLASRPRRCRGALTRSLDPTHLLSPLSLYLSDLTSPPGSWRTPRYDARFLDGRGFKEFLRYLENNPVDAGLVERAVDWPWSSARAHCDGVDGDDLLSFDRWRHVFGRPENIAADWMVYLEGPREELRRNAGRVRSFHTGSRHNRPVRWVAAAPG
jgi:hypothetical protein